MVSHESIKNYNITTTRQSTVKCIFQGIYYSWDYKEIVTFKSKLFNMIFFIPGFWLAGSTAASQSEAMLENPNMAFSQ